MGLIDRPPLAGGRLGARRRRGRRPGYVREPRGKARFRTLGRLPTTLRTPFSAAGAEPARSSHPRQNKLMLRTALPRTAAALLVGSAAFASVGCQVAPLPEGYSWNIKQTDKSNRGASHRNGLDASRVDTVNAATNSGGKAYNFASALPGTSRSAAGSNEAPRSLAHREPGAARGGPAGPLRRRARPRHRPLRQPRGRPGRRLPGRPPAHARRRPQPRRRHPHRRARRQPLVHRRASLRQRPQVPGHPRGESGDQPAEAPRGRPAGAAGVVGWDPVIYCRGFRTSSAGPPERV